MSFPAPKAIWPLLSAAEEHAARQDWDAAIASYERALAQAPGDPCTLVQLSYVHSLAGHYRLASRHAQAAARGGASDPALLLELLPRLRTFNQVPAMLECVERLLPMSRMPIPLLLAVAAQLSYANLPDRAIAFLDEARRADPDFPPTLLSRGKVLTYLGRFEEAGQDLARARAAPRAGDRAGLLAAGVDRTADRRAQPRRSDPPRTGPPGAQAGGRGPAGIRPAQGAGRPRPPRRGMAGAGAGVPRQALAAGLRSRRHPGTVRRAGGVRAGAVACPRSARTCAHAPVHRRHAPLGYDPAGAAARQPSAGAGYGRAVRLHLRDAPGHRPPLPRGPR